jgi:hypothetical protein
MPITDQIPRKLLAQYLAREITSKDVAAATGYHPVSIRRAIQRDPITPQPKNKRVLIDARKAFRATLAHLPAAEIQKIAHVSLSTANRIRKAGKNA